VVASPTGYSGDDIRHLMLESVEKRFGDQRPATPVQWLSDNGSAYTAEQTRLFARQIGLQPVTTPVRSPKINGMAESFVKTIKRDYVAHMPKPDRETALRNLAIAFEHYNEYIRTALCTIARRGSSGAWQSHQFNGELVSGFVGASPTHLNLIVRSKRFDNLMFTSARDGALALMIILPKELHHAWAYEVQDIRSINPTSPKVAQHDTLASPASSSMAARMQ
jgi:hypothetical protein